MTADISNVIRYPLSYQGRSLTKPLPKSGNCMERMTQAMADVQAEISSPDLVNTATLIRDSSEGIMECLSEFGVNIPDTCKADYDGVMVDLQDVATIIQSTMDTTQLMADFTDMYTRGAQMVNDCPAASNSPAKALADGKEDMDTCVADVTCVANDIFDAIAH